MTPKRSIQLDDLYHIAQIEDIQISPDERWIAYVHIRMDRDINDYVRNIWLVSTAGGAPIQLTRGSADAQPRWSPDGKTLAFVSLRSEQAQLYLIPVTAPGGEAYPITRMMRGVSEPSWSPDGRMIAFVSPLNAAERAQENNPAPPPIDTLDARHRQERMIYEDNRRYDPYVAWRVPYRDGYGKSFNDERYRQIYVLEVEAGTPPNRLTDIDADHSAPQWMPDGKSLITVRSSEPMRDEPVRWDTIYRIWIDGKTSERLTFDSYAARQPQVAPNGQQIAYVRLPHENLYCQVPRVAIVRDAGEQHGHDLTDAQDRSALDCRWSADGTHIYFRFNDRGSTLLSRVDTANQQIEPVIQSEVEIQSFDIGPSGSVAYVAASANNPTELFWLPAAGAPVQLTHIHDPLLEQIEVQPSYELCFSSNDQVIQGWYLLPPGYKAGNAYPTILHIHGGPRLMWGPGTRAMWHEWQHQAAQGYVVFFCNPTGSDGYGEAFQRQAYGVDYPDLMTGVDTLIERGLTDPGRLAVTGGSYGGYMTAWIISQTERFKAAVAHRGMYNLMSYYGTTDFPFPLTQEFGGGAWENADEMWQRSPLAHAHKIKTPLLLMHSENDYRTPISEAEQLFSYVKLSGGTVTMLRFPREGHEMARSGEPRHREQRLAQMIDWINRYCLTVPE